MTGQNTHTNAMRGGAHRGDGAHRGPRFGRLALLAVAFCAARVWAGEAMTFPLMASGFEVAVVGDAQGRLVQRWRGRPQRLAPGRWVAVDFDTKTSVWFDDAGRVSARGPYVELGSRALPRHPDAPDRSPLFSAWSQHGTGLLRADGSVFVGWQPERGGAWAITAHPQRYSWRSRDAGERIFDQHGRLRLQLGEHELRAAGPFVGRAQYLVCDLSLQAPCALRDEAGATLWTAQVDDLLPLGRGGWLGRQGNAWRRFDAHGRLAGDRARIYLAGQFFPRVRQQADATTPAWPRWMTEYRVAHEDAQTLEVDKGSAVGGLMHADGRFVPVAGATSGMEVCPGVWRFAMDAGGDRLGDADGRLLARFQARSWKELDGHPALRVAIAEDGQETLVDCQGRSLAETPPLVRLSAEPAGLIATLVDEQQPRLWLDADLRPHLLPEGSAIEKTSRDGALLVVRIAGDGLRLYDVEGARFVGAAFAYAEALLPGGVVFLRDGYHGFMDGDGNERLPPRYNAVTPWGGDRLWSARYVDEGALDTQLVTLHRMDGSIVASWRDATVRLEPMLADRPDAGPVTQLIAKTFETAQGSYFGQQWVDREGRALFLAMKCFGTSKETEGAVIEPSSGAPLRTGADCAIPAPIREAMAPLPSAEKAAAARSAAGAARPALAGTRSRPSSRE